jgi:hypothetical protein
MDYPSAPSFRTAGYADLQTNGSYVGGLVRQHGNVSFSRVFQAGHAVAAYQPETVYRILERAIFGKDVATGKVDVGSNYSSTGPVSSWGHTEELPDSPPSVCYLYGIQGTCTLEEVEALVNGTAVVEDYIVRIKGAGDGNGTGQEPGKNGGGRVGSSGLGAMVVSLCLGAVLLSL